MTIDVNVLMIGSNTKVKGGMTTVVQSFLNHRFSKSIHLTFIASHSEKGRIYNSFFFLKALFAINTHLLFRNPQIVHLHMSDKGSFIRKYIIFKVSKLLNKRVIVHMHGGNFDNFYLGLPKLLKVCANELLEKADKVITLGGNWEKILRSIEPKANIKVLKNSVPIPEFVERNQQEEFNILFLAVINKEKGILDLIQASIPVIEKAVRQRKNVVFEIAGDGPALMQAKRMVADAGISSFYRFHGWVGFKEKKMLLERCDLFVLPSYFEALPMSVLEAISYGIPVVSTNVGSVDEAVRDGINGSLIEPGDISALTKYLDLHLYHDAPFEFRKASRTIALSNFDEKNYFEQIEELYLSSFQIDR
ncbi:glycosyltransferase family 4 protein [Planococcus glaciei]|uniref:glycosyltransferase family 4 protein n=1 Tax=Planococcus glaciei TaxID=459472 RepID=UPI001C7373E9|nr:glycosyltransferase family 4 protein [Planococcus glaciei]MBX0313322.1 glycosyltransferase family 4 protein [Planococcus glaciei]